MMRFCWKRSSSFTPLVVKFDGIEKEKSDIWLKDTSYISSRCASIKPLLNSDISGKKPFQSKIRLLLFSKNITSWCNVFRLSKHKIVQFILHFAHVLLLWNFSNSHWAESMLKFHQPFNRPPEILFKLVTLQKCDIASRLKMALDLSYEKLILVFLMRICKLFFFKTL